MKKLLILLSLIFCATMAHATVQMPERLVYKGKSYDLRGSAPMARYFDAHPDKLPETDAVMTALWRGYIATYEIKCGKLYVADIEVRRMQGDDVVAANELNRVFPGRKRVKADWFTGRLVLPVVSGDSVYSTGGEYLVLDIVDGKVKGRSRATLTEAEYDSYMAG